MRKCYHSYIQDAIAKLSPIVYGRNHPIYQNILYNNARDVILMPQELKSVLQKFVSGSKTNTLGKCQGGDAMLEELHKDAKSWLKMAGIPSEEQWLFVFRNIDKLNEVENQIESYKIHNN